MAVHCNVLQKMMVFYVSMLIAVSHYLSVAETSSTAGRLWKRDEVDRLYTVTSDSSYVTTHDDVSSPLDCSRLCKASETCEFFLYSKTDRRCVVACPSPCWRASVGKGGTYALYMLSTAFRDTTGCPVASLNYQFFPGTGSCLRADTTNKTPFVQQQPLCQNEGARLVDIKTQLKYDVMDHMLHAVQGTTLLTAKTVWVNASKVGSSWSWGDGTAATLVTSHWGTGEPSGGQNCVGMNMGMLFADLDCLGNYYTVCQIDL